MTVGEATVGVCWCMVESVCIVGFCICDEVEMKKHSGMNTFSFVIGRHSIFVTWEESGLHFSFVGVIHHIIIQLLTDLAGRRRFSAGDFGFSKVR